MHMGGMLRLELMRRQSIQGHVMLPLGLDDYLGVNTDAEVADVSRPAWL
jgi:hypothetical protein